MSLWGYIGTIIACIIGYLIGSMSWSIIIGKLLFKKDVRNYYSKNAGATNASRVIGIKFGIVVMVLDMLKVPITMVITMGISTIHTNVDFGSTSLYIVALFTIIGHCFPVYFKFKGGKGVSCLIGLTWMINPFYFVIWAVIWWVLFFIYRRVSLSSILATIVAIAICWIPQLSLVSEYNVIGNYLLDSRVVWFNHAHYLNYNGYADNLYLINTVLSLSGILLIALHYQNIYRLFKGEEKRFQLKK